MSSKCFAVTPCTNDYVFYILFFNVCRSPCPAGGRRQQQPPAPEPGDYEGGAHIPGRNSRAAGLPGRPARPDPWGGPLPELGPDQGGSGGRVGGRLLSGRSGTAGLLLLSAGRAPNSLAREGIVSIHTVRSLSINLGG